MTGWKHPIGVAIMSCLWVTACADEGTVEEPVVESDQTNVYPDDPAMTEDPMVDNESDPFPEGGEPEDGIGELTDEPFSDADAGVDPADDFDHSIIGDDESGTSDSEMTEMYSDSFENEPGYDITEPIEAEGATIPDSIANSNVGDGTTDYSSNGEVVRYVDALLLNVRSSPTLGAPIVRRLLGGARLKVTLENGFAKLKDGQYVSEKFLSSTPTRKVSRSEVVKAWKKSKYKDTWVPPRH